MDTIKTYALPGSISHGTLRTEDLLARFTRELEWLTQSGRNDRTDKETQLIVDAHDVFNALTADCENDNAIEDAEYLLNERLFDALDKFAPDGHYFGAHPGDGSDFGYWPSEEE